MGLFSSKPEIRMIRYHESVYQNITVLEVKLMDWRSIFCEYYEDSYKIYMNSSDQVFKDILRERYGSHKEFATDLSDERSQFINRNRLDCPAHFILGGRKYPNLNDLYPNLNGLYPYMIKIEGNSLQIYEALDGAAPPYSGEPRLVISDIFGKIKCEEDSGYRDNSMLIDMGENRYVFIGDIGVHVFTTEHKIVGFKSPVDEGTKTPFPVARDLSGNAYIFTTEVIQIPEISGKTQGVSGETQGISLYSRYKNKEFVKAFSLKNQKKKL